MWLGVDAHPAETAFTTMSDLDIIYDEDSLKQTEFAQASQSIYATSPAPQNTLQRTNTKRKHCSSSNSQSPPNQQTKCYAPYALDGSKPGAFPDDRHFLLHSSLPCFTTTDARQNLSKLGDDLCHMEHCLSYGEHIESIHVVQHNSVTGNQEYSNVPTHLLYVCLSKEAKQLLQSKLQEHGLLRHAIDYFFDFSPPTWSTLTSHSEPDTTEFQIVQSNKVLEELSHDNLIKYAKMKCPPNESLELVKVLKRDDCADHIINWLYSLDQKQCSK